MASVQAVCRHLETVRTDGASLGERIARLRPYATYRRLQDAWEVDAALALRYRAYRDADAVPPRADRRLSDAYDGLPNSAIFGLFFEDRLCASIRLHVVCEAGQSSPAFTAFGDVLDPLLATGESFVDTNCFCVEPLLSGTAPELAYLILRVPVMAGEMRLGSLLTATIREGHTGFYRRIMRGRLAAAPRPYPGRLKPFGLVLVDYRAERENILGRTPAFTPMPGEGEAIGMACLRDRPVPRPAMVTA